MSTHSIHSNTGQRIYLAELSCLFYLAAKMKKPLSQGLPNVILDTSTECQKDFKAMVEATYNGSGLEFSEESLELNNLVRSLWEKIKANAKMKDEKLCYLFHHDAYRLTKAQGNLWTEYAEKVAKPINLDSWEEAIPDGLVAQ